MDSYPFWKTAHIISAAVLFGTGMGIAFFAWFGYRRALKNNSIEALRTVLQLTVLGDTCFTAPAVAFQIISGMVLIGLNGWPWISPWSMTALGLYLAVGFLWLPVVYIQIILAREADQQTSIGDLSPQFHRRFRTWFILGIPAFLLVIYLYYLMVAKTLAFT